MLYFLYNHKINWIRTVTFQNNIDDQNHILQLKAYLDSNKNFTTQKCVCQIWIYYIPVLETESFFVYMYQQQVPYLITVTKTLYMVLP